IIRNDSTDPVNNTFASTPEGASLNISGQQFTISYVGGDGNDVVLTALPVPGTGNTKVWSGAGTNGFWSNGSNWVGNVAPAQGDDLLFPPAGVRRVNTNDFAWGFNVNWISFSDGSYTCRGNLALLNAGVTNRFPSTAASFIV